MTFPHITVSKCKIYIWIIHSETKEAGLKIQYFYTLLFLSVKYILVLIHSETKEAGLKI